jgi:hypothetical protein
MSRLLLIGFFFAAAAPALAARNTPPPPSGQVVHLFGPQGIWANLAPVVGGAQPPPASVAPAAPGPLAATTAAPPSATPTAAPAAQSYPEPSLGAILHQMFVTGDPNAGPGFAQGRKGN